MQEARHVVQDVRYKEASLRKSCAENIVKQVEANALGCCARTCGWDGESCNLWPLMSADSQRDWQEECCSEETVLRHSLREKMCDSMLSEADRKIADAKDEPSTPSERLAVGQDLPASMRAQLGSSLIHLSQLGEKSCADDDFIHKCPPTQQEINQQACGELQKWKVMEPIDYTQLLYSIVEGSEDCVENTGAAACHKKHVAGKRVVFEWTLKTRQQRCCQFNLEPGTHPKFQDYDPTKVRLHDVMNGKLLFLPK
ncbi:Fem1b [Symbiodinium sp. CCMP2592]|nr:Fem1b [Symbiodinium sp. CCMP2592]